MGLDADLTADIDSEHVFYDSESGFGIDTDAGLRLLFDNEYADFESGGAAVVGTLPRAWCRSSEAPAVGDYLVIKGTDYIVRNVQPNGEGETYLTLHETLPDT